MSQELSFDSWMKAVDAAIARRCHMGANDLPDVNYRGLYQAGDTPDLAAIFAIRNAAGMDTDDESEPFDDNS